MQTFTDTDERERLLADSLKDLDCVNKEIAQLMVWKEQLTQNVISALGHEHEGQKSYEYDTYQLEVKTPFVYSLNKKMYESTIIPKEFNPIKESKSYSIDKKLFEKYMSEAPEEVRDVLVDLVDKKPGKASITIKERSK